jgi:hypothetical protein
MVITENPYYSDHDAFVKAAAKLRAIVARAKGSSFPEERDTAKRMYNKVLSGYAKTLGRDQAKKLEFLVRPPFKLDNEPDPATMAFNDYRKKFREHVDEGSDDMKVSSIDPTTPYKPWNPRGFKKNPNYKNSKQKEDGKKAYSPKTSGLQGSVIDIKA